MARTREARGERVVVDLYLLNGGSRDAGSVGLDAVHHQRDTVGSDGVVVEEARHGGDVVLIEDGNAVERIAIDGGGILVGGIVGADGGRRVSGGDGDAFVENRDLHGDANGTLTLTGQAYFDAGFAEAFSLKVERVVSRSDVIETESARAIRDGLYEQLVIRREERNFRISDGGSRGIEDSPANGAIGLARCLICGLTWGLDANVGAARLREGQGREQNTNGRDYNPEKVSSHSNLQEV